MIKRVSSKVIEKVIDSRVRDCVLRDGEFAAEGGEVPSSVYEVEAINSEAAGYRMACGKVRVEANGSGGASYLNFLA